MKQTLTDNILELLPTIFNGQRVLDLFEFLRRVQPYFSGQDSIIPLNVIGAVDQLAKLGFIYRDGSDIKLNQEYFP